MNTINRKIISIHRIALKILAFTIIHITCVQQYVPHGRGNAEVRIGMAVMNEMMSRPVFGPGPMKMDVVNGEVAQTVSDIAESYRSGEQKCAVHGHQQYKYACQHHQHHCGQEERQRIVARWIQVV